MASSLKNIYNLQVKL